MKKIVEVILVFIMVINMSACDSNDDYKSPGEQMCKMGKIIIESFEKKDKESLLALFSKNTEKRYSLEKEIESAFEFFDSEIVEYGEIHGDAGGGYRTAEEGWVERVGSGVIEKIRTQSGTTYTIIFGVCLIDKNNEDNVGVTDITIRNVDIYETYGVMPEFKCTIGGSRQYERSVFQRNVSEFKFTIEG